MLTVLCCECLQVPSGTKDVKVGSLIALIVAEGEDWKDVAIPVLGGPAVPIPMSAPTPAAATSTSSTAVSSPGQ